MHCHLPSCPGLCWVFREKRKADSKRMNRVSSVQSLGCVQLFVTPWTAACPAIAWSFSNSCPLSWWCHPTISSSVVSFSYLQSFPASGSFPEPEDSKTTIGMEGSLRRAALAAMVLGRGPLWVSDGWVDPWIYVGDLLHQVDEWRMSVLAGK